MDSNIKWRHGMMSLDVRQRNTPFEQEIVDGCLQVFRAAQRNFGHLLLYLSPCVRTEAFDLLTFSLDDVERDWATIHANAFLPAVSGNYVTAACQAGARIR